MVVEQDQTNGPEVSFDPLVLPRYEVDYYVVPVANVLPDDSLRLHGTAFFINASGVFLTAGHVMSAAQADAAATGGAASIIVRNEKGGHDCIYEILRSDFALHPFDVAVGVIEGRSKSFVRLADSTAGYATRDILTFGYPESASIRDQTGKLTLGMRSLKGYITRRLDAYQLATHAHPAAFELSFAVPQALSGAPLVLARPATPLEHALMEAPGVLPVIGGVLVDPRSIRRHGFHLLGVCVGTQEAETVAFSHTEVVDGTTRFVEKTSKIELYGLAHDLLPLADWTPSCLNGLSLAGTISPS